MLPFVSQPAQYLGNEVNIIRRNLDDVDVRVALVFPDVYKVGMSYMGFPILYNILNKQRGVYAERAFSPWIDMEEMMRTHGIPLFSLETFSPISDFDVVGFTFQYELHFTTILNLLDLAGIKLEAAERHGFPLVIGGGPSAFNPEPVADFFDAILLGDGEEAIVEIVEVVRRARQENLSRRQTLEAMAGIKGVYVPQFYKPVYRVDGRFDRLERINPAAPTRIRARTLQSLKKDFYPEKPLVPMVQTTHDRITLEIARGCSRGCRFCNAGMTYRPVRQRPVSELVEQAKKNFQATGYEEISLVSLSTSDYTRLGELVNALQQSFVGEEVNISFPSLRPESFTPEVAAFAKGVRKSGLTLAPEAGSQRLRDVINKATTEDELLRAVDLAFREGWTLVKLYFMIGHPTETMQDIEGLVDLIRQVEKVANRYKGKRINISISPFIPKAMTPFQWVRQDSKQETQEKLDFIASHIRSKKIKLSWRNADNAAVEGLIARGDRRVGQIIKRAWQLGAKLDGWSELFRSEFYEKAAAEIGLTFEQFTGGYELDQPLPWDHIDKGIAKKFLRQDYLEALQEQALADCRFTSCHQCGLMGHNACKSLISKQKAGEPLEQPVEFQDFKAPHIVPPPAEEQSDRKVTHMRLHYKRGHEVRFLSHLDMLRLFERALRRARIPVAYSQGFNPHPRIAFGPSLATGMTSDAEYMDLQVREISAEELKSRLQHQLPGGIDIIEVKKLEKRPQALSAILNTADYECQLIGLEDQSKIESRTAAILEKEELVVQRKTKNKIRPVNVRPFIDSFSVTHDGFFLRSRMDGGKSIRFSELLSLLFPDEEHVVKTALVHRKALWLQDGASFVDPMQLC